MASRESPTNIAVITARLIELILEMSLEDRCELLSELDDRRLKGRRKFHRKNYFMDVDVATAKGVFKGFIQNISSDGALIDTDESLVVGQDIIMAFALPDNKGPIKIKGEVSRILPKAVGVRFSTAVDNLTK